MKRASVKLHRVNLIAALISLAGACVWFATAQTVTGMIWLVCSLVWLASGVAHRRSLATEREPMKRLARRVSRLLLWS